MFDREILVFEFLAVDALAAGAVSVGEVSALDHEVLDNTVEDGSLVAETFSRGFAGAALAGAEGAEVLGGFGDDVIVEFEGNAAFVVVADLDVEVDLGSGW